MKTIFAISMMLPLSLFAKFAKIIQLDEPPRSAFVDDETVYIVTTTVRKYFEARFDPKLGQFVGARSKRIIKFADGERLTRLDRLGGIGTGGAIVGYAGVEFKQGTVVFAYPFDADVGKVEVCSNFLTQAVDGDRITYQSNGTNISFVASFSSKDNALHWLDPVTFDVCESLPPPDHDKTFCYSRMQNTNCIVSIFGGRIKKDIGIVRFSEHDIDKVYRIVESAGPEHPIAEANLLYRDPERKDKAGRPSLLTPRKFYVVLNDGRRAFGMFQPDIEKNAVLFSPITSAPLAVAKDDIVGFEAIGDNAFPIAECYTKNEVDLLYEKFVSHQEGTKPIAARRTLREILCAIAIAFLGWFVPNLLQPFSDSLNKWLGARKRIYRITIVLSLFAALIFLIFT